MQIKGGGGGGGGGEVGRKRKIKLGHRLEEQHKKRNGMPVLN